MAREAAGTGIAANCVIPRVQKLGSLGDVGTSSQAKCK